MFRNLELSRCLLTALFVAGVLPLWAGSPVTFQSSEKQALLLELYTSQGCSSCPPAEKWIGRLVSDRRLWKEIVPMALHVDYWDWIGWKDPFASPDYTLRQREYKKARRVKTVYTPCFVANGREWRAWFSMNRKLPKSTVRAGRLEGTVNNGDLSVRYHRTAGALVLHVALLGVGLSTRVERGENAGRTLKHDFSVLAMTQQSSTNATWSLALPTPRDASARRYAIALWVSRPDSLLPLQSTGAWLPGYRPPIDS
jgi:hypothetical protein